MTTISGYDTVERLARQVAALETEKRQHEARGQADRAAQVDAQLKVYRQALDAARKAATENDN